MVSSYFVLAFTVDCLGGWSEEAKEFSRELGRRIVKCTGETSASLYFRKKIGLAIQRGNAASTLWVPSVHIQHLTKSIFMTMNYNLSHYIALIGWKIYIYKKLSKKINL